MKTNYSTQAREAIQAAGGQAKLARKLAADVDGLTEDRALWRIQKWAYNGIPPSFVPLVEKHSGVPRKRIRPDLFGDAA